MFNNKNIKLCLGLTAILALSSCNTWWDNQRAEPMNAHYEPVRHQGMVNTNAVKTTRVQKSYASKDPVQRATPGPVRKAAPQIPAM